MRNGSSSSIGNTNVPGGVYIKKNHIAEESMPKAIKDDNIDIITNNYEYNNINFHMLGILKNLMSNYSSNKNE